MTKERTNGVTYTVLTTTSFALSFSSAPCSSLGGIDSVNVILQRECLLKEGFLGLC